MGYDNYVQRGYAQICRVHSLLDRPPFHRRGACHFQRCCSFRTRLAEILWNLVSLLEDAGGVSGLRARASCVCGGWGGVVWVLLRMCFGMGEYALMLAVRRALRTGRGVRVGCV